MARELVHFDARPLAVSGFLALCEREVAATVRVTAHAHAGGISLLIQAPGLRRALHLPWDEAVTLVDGMTAILADRPIEAASTVVEDAPPALTVDGEQADG